MDRATASGQVTSLSETAAGLALSSMNREIVLLTSLRAVARRQWEAYPSSHARPENLALHAVGVPAFLLGNCVLVVSLAKGDLSCAGLGLLTMLGAFAAQVIGHRLEPQAPLPFAGLSDAVTRILVEQWVTFPRYLLSRFLTRRRM